MSHLSKKTLVGSKTLRVQMDERQDRLDELSDLKHLLGNIENEIKSTLIKEHQTDLLSVNWTRLRRTI